MLHSNIIYHHRLSVLPQKDNGAASLSVLEPHYFFIPVIHSLLLKAKEESTANYSAQEHVHIGFSSSEKERKE